MLQIPQGTQHLGQATLQEVQHTTDLQAADPAVLTRSHQEAAQVAPDQHILRPAGPHRADQVLIPHLAGHLQAGQVLILLQAGPALLPAVRAHTLLLADLAAAVVIPEAAQALHAVAQVLQEAVAQAHEAVQVLQEAAHHGHAS